MWRQVWPALAVVFLALDRNESLHIIPEGSGKSLTKAKKLERNLAYTGYSWVLGDPGRSCADTCDPSGHSGNCNEDMIKTTDSEEKIFALGEKAGFHCDRTAGFKFSEFPKIDVATGVCSYRRASRYTPSCGEPTLKHDHRFCSCGSKWYKGHAGETCNAVCSRFTLTCNETALAACNTKDKVFEIAKIFQMPCAQEIRTWAKEFPSQATDGSCTYTYGYQDNCREVVGITERRYCPCKDSSVHTVAIPNSTSSATPERKKDSTSVAIPNSTSSAKPETTKNIKKLAAIPKKLAVIPDPKTATKQKPTTVAIPKPIGAGKNETKKTLTNVAIPKPIGAGKNETKKKSTNAAIPNSTSSAKPETKEKPITVAIPKPIGAGKTETKKNPTNAAIPRPIGARKNETKTKSTNAAIPNPISSGKSQRNSTNTVTTTAHSYMINIHGHSFDVHAEGISTFLQFPQQQSGARQSPQLRVDASIELPNAVCRHWSIIRLWVTGSIIGEGVTISTSGSSPFSPNALLIKAGKNKLRSLEEVAAFITNGKYNFTLTDYRNSTRTHNANRRIFATMKLDLAMGARLEISWFTSMRNSNSLSFTAKGLKFIGKDWGGLLGSENHTGVSSHNPNCDLKAEKLLVETGPDPLLGNASLD